MVHGWVLWVVLSSGLGRSTLSIHYGFATEAECRAAGASAVSGKDRWVCSKASRP